MKYIWITAILLTIISCTSAQQAEALKDSRAALDKACELRAVELKIQDAGAHD